MQRSRVWSTSTSFFYHSCLSCFRPHDTSPLMSTPFEKLHTSGEEKLQMWRSVYGVHTVIIREHNWVEMTKSCAEVKEFLEDFKSPEPLSPYHTLNGGRTSTVRLRYTAGDCALRLDLSVPICELKLFLLVRSPFHYSQRLWRTPEALWLNRVCTCLAGSFSPFYF